MKCIEYFEIIDMGIQAGMEPNCLRMQLEIADSLFNGWVVGVGTDAESALDDMLHLMQEQDYDITGLESQIKEDWEPSQEEGDGRSFYYHFVIIFKFKETP